MSMTLPFPPPSGLDQEESALATAYHKFLWLVVFITAACTVIVSFVYPNDVARWLLLVLFVESSCFVGIFLNSRGRMRPAVWMSDIAFWITSTIFSLTVPVLIFFSTSAYILIVVASGLLLDRKSGLKFAVLCGVTRCCCTGQASWDSGLRSRGITGSLIYC